MRRQSSEFAPVDGLDGIFMARSGKLNCFALRLRDGSLCLYSPVSGMSATHAAQLESLGGVTALLAPNHYHNKGLEEHVKAFPGAMLCCSAAAELRLRKVTGLSFAPLDALTPHLIEEQELLEPEGLKTGEVWVEISGAETAWIVTDAFSAELLPPGEFAASPTRLGTFPRYGVTDADRYTRWVLGRLEVSAPSCLLPCHGSPVKAQDLGPLLAGILEGIS